MKSYIFLADGFEEIEALSTIDILRRAGLDVKSVTINEHRTVTGAHNVKVEADMTFKEADFDSTDWMILPGGMPGASNLHNFRALGELLRIHSAKGRIAAICAAPAVVLAPLGLLDGRHATCYPGFEDALTLGGAEHKDERVVIDGNIVTANGPSSAFLFALTIVSLTLGHQAAENVATGMLM